MSFFRIPLTDESKLLPAPGIYAVSFESGKYNSKGMVVIHSKTEDDSEVLLHLFDDDRAVTGNNSTVFFHKRIHGSVNLKDHAASAMRLKAALNEISELIY